MMMMVTRIGVIRALHRNVERVFNPDRKAEGSMIWFPRSEPGNKVVALFSRGHFPRRSDADSAGLTREETIEFEALDALPPFDDRGNLAWSFEGGPMTRREQRWLELYLKKGS